jgi:hypothetical protein
MDTSETSILARLIRCRADLREAVDDLDRAIAGCQEEKREALETLAELDSALSFHGDPGE